MLDDGLSDLDALDQQIRRAMQISIPLAKQKVGLQLASYQAGKSNLSNVITARQALLEQRCDLLIFNNNKQLQQHNFILPLKSRP
jgi:outer membrane protein TolC